jgi:molecular chaperone DnaK (HSP70)
MPKDAEEEEENAEEDAQKEENAEKEEKAENAAGALAKSVEEPKQDNSASASEKDQIRAKIAKVSYYLTDITVAIGYCTNYCSNSNTT